jgi:hypothetical protein
MTNARSCVPLLPPPRRSPTSRGRQKQLLKQQQHKAQSMKQQQPMKLTTQQPQPSAANTFAVSSYISTNSNSNSSHSTSRSDIDEDCRDLVELSEDFVLDAFDDYCIDQGDDDDFSLTQLIDETSKRWQQTALSTHVDFCRLAQCSVCAAAKQQQLQEATTEEEPPVEFPMEQIEVYRSQDGGSDVCSVTSALTHHVDTAANTNTLQAGDRSIVQRPDAESVSGDVQQQQQHQRVRGRLVQLQAADGSVRQAIYSGPLAMGQPHGVGIFKFVETHDFGEVAMYIGEVAMGAMHGQGTYTFKQRPDGATKVLKGTFQNNVFTGHYEE